MKTEFSFGMRLERLRERKGFSLCQLAKKCGISKGQMSRMEIIANPNPTLDTLERLSKGLGVRISELVE